MFPPTSWTQVRRAVESSGSGGQASLNTLVSTYRGPMLALAQSRGLQLADAENLVQEVQAKVFRPESLGGLSPSAGRFSAWLSQAVRHAWADYLRAGNRQCRDRRATVPLDAAAQLPQPENMLRFLDAARAAECLEAVRRKLNPGSPGFASLWQAMTGTDAGQQELADEAGVSYAAFRKQLAALRAAVLEQFRREVQKGVLDPGEVPAERRHLLRLALATR